MHKEVKIISFDLKDSFSPKSNVLVFSFKPDRLEQLDVEICKSQQLSHMGADLTQRYRGLDAQLGLFFSMLLGPKYVGQQRNTRGNKGPPQRATRDPPGPSKDTKLAISHM